MVAARNQSDVLKLVHPGRHIEILRSPITAGEIMERYPRHCVARPDVFEFPWIAVHPQSVLSPGEMFYLVPFHTMNTLMKAKSQQQIQSLFTSKENLQTSKCYAPQGPKSLKCTIGLRSSTKNQQANARWQVLQRCLKEGFYKSSSDKTRGAIRRNLNRSRDGVDKEEKSTAIQHRRPRVTSPEQTELLRIKPCLRKPDSVGKKIDLRVRFAPEVVRPSLRTAYKEGRFGFDSLMTVAYVCCRTNSLIWKNLIACERETSS